MYFFTQNGLGNLCKAMKKFAFLYAKPGAPLNQIVISFIKRQHTMTESCYFQQIEPKNNNNNSKQRMRMLHVYVSILYYK